MGKRQGQVKMGEDKNLGRMFAGNTTVVSAHLDLPAYSNIAVEFVGNLGMELMSVGRQKIRKTGGREVMAGEIRQIGIQALAIATIIMHIQTKVKNMKRGERSTANYLISVMHAIIF